MNRIIKIVKIVDKVISIPFILLFLIITVYSLYAFWDSVHIYSQAMPDSYQEFKPLPNDKENLETLIKKNNDVIGWVMINNTKIDYPVVQGENNLEYLNKNIYKEFSLSGAIYLDSRNKRDFSDNYNVLYGHHMAGHAMFGDLDLFLDENFFKYNRLGSLYLLDKNYSLDIFAVMKVAAVDKFVFTSDSYDDINMKSVLDYFQKFNIHYRKIKIDVNDKIIVLSTCAPETNQRIVVIAKMIERK